MDRIEKQELLSESIINFQEDLLRSNQGLTKGVLLAHTESLQEMWAKFRKSHERILKKYKPRNCNYLRLDVYSRTQREYNRILGFLYDEQIKMAPSAQRLSTGTSAGMRNHLPRINLPRFSGRLEEWESFRDLFISLVHDDDSLSSVQKLHFLKTTLDGEAKAALDKLSITEDNYEIAWRLLLKRFDNRQLLVTRHLSALASLPTLIKEGSENLQGLLDDVDSRRAALTKLQRPTQHWDDLFVFFITRALDPATRKDWDKSSADANYFPTYKDIYDFLQSRIRASTTPVPKVRGQLRSLGTSVSASPMTTCPACQDRHHPMRCQRFLKASSSERRDMVRRAKLCFNCLKLDHQVNACPSSQTCKECQGQHHTLLHRPLKRYAPADPTNGSPKRLRGPETSVDPSKPGKGDDPKLSS